MEIVSKIYDIDTYMDKQYYTSSFSTPENALYYVEEYKNLLKEVEQTFTDGRRSIEAFSVMIKNGSKLSPDNIKKLVRKIMHVIGCKVNFQKFIVFTTPDNTYEVMIFNRYIKKEKLTNVVRNILVYNKPNSGIFTKSIQVIKSLINSWTDNTRRNKDNVKYFEHKIQLKKVPQHKTAYEIISNNREVYYKLLYKHVSIVISNLYKYCYCYK